MSGRIIRSVPREIAEPTPTVVREWQVVYDGAAVIDVIERPGFLRSTATPPPGFTPPTHPFVDVTSIDGKHEHRLRGYLLASTTLIGFLERLVAAGYDLAPPNIERWDLQGVRISRGDVALACAWPVPGPTRALHHALADGADAHTSLTIYDDAHDAILRAQLASSDDFVSFASALDALGYTLGP